ncbi:MAG TPA: AraC family transcriptional regulator, partial [Victivallales bacterium]|nr:AraC family transcriptional regulator [Victivallales bacterium]
LAQHCDEKTGYYFPKDSKEPWIFLWISFFGGFSADCVNSLVRHYGYIYELPRETGIIAEIEAFKGLKGSIVRLSPLAGAKLFMDVICGLDSSISRKKNDSSITSIHKAQMLLMKRISEGVSVQYIADELSMSREHFSRLFKKHTGISPDYYIRREKLKYSCELLKETELSVKEISHRVGYDSVASFCRVFKSFLKMTPEQFRKIGHYPGWL